MSRNLADVLLIAFAAACAGSTTRPALAPAAPPRLEGRSRAERLSLLEAALKSPAAEVRVEAARRIGREFLLAPGELGPLVRALRDPELAVRLEAARAIERNLPVDVARAAAPQTGRGTAAKTGRPAAPGPPAAEPASAPRAAADPFRAPGDLARRNLAYLRALRKAVDAALALPPAALGPPLPASPLRLLDRTTLGPNVPVPVGSQGLPP